MSWYDDWIRKNYGDTPHRWNKDGDYVGPYRSLDEMPDPAPLQPVYCACRRRLDAAGSCVGCGIISECQCDALPV